VTNSRSPQSLTPASEFTPEIKPWWFKGKRLPFLLGISDGFFQGLFLLDSFREAGKNRKKRNLISEAIG